VGAYRGCPGGSRRGYRRSGPARRVPCGAAARGSRGRGDEGRADGAPEGAELTPWRPPARDSRGTRGSECGRAQRPHVQSLIQRTRGSLAAPRRVQATVPAGTSEAATGTGGSALPPPARRRLEGGRGAGYGPVPGGPVPDPPRDREVRRGAPSPTRAPGRRPPHPSSAPGRPAPGALETRGWRTLTSSWSRSRPRPRHAPAAAVPLPGAAMEVGGDALLQLPLETGGESARERCVWAGRSR